MDLNGAKVLVTGAGGFIGSHLAERLVREGCTVRAMLHYDSRSGRGNLDYVEPSVLREIEVISGDVRDPYFMRRALKDRNAVFHLAALIGIPYSYAAPASYLQINAMGTLNTLQACLDEGVERIIHTSTSEAYGTARYQPIDEDHPLQGQSPYSASKIAADKIAESYHLSFGLPVVTLRPFNTFGPRQSARAVIPTILSQLLTGRESLRLGSLEPIRDFNYVENTVDGFVAAACSDDTVGQLVNVGSNESISIRDLAALAMEIVDRAVPIVTEHTRVRPAKSEVGLLICGWDRAKQLMGWSPRVDFKEGLRRTAAFVSDHLDQYRPEEYAI